MLSKANLLMLDEPTNHLDMFSKEVLESALNRYEGTVIYISHDRYFINKTAEKILELTPDGVILYNGNYDYYLEKKAERARNEAEKAAQHPEKSVAAAQPVSDTKNDWLKQKNSRRQSAGWRTELRSWKRPSRRPKRRLRRRMRTWRRAARITARQMKFMQRKQNLRKGLRLFSQNGRS